MRGLTSLTEPAGDDRVGAIVDVAVIGARGDGKTQFIVHAIRTLRAYAPLLEGAEHQYNRDVLQVVMNAREPRPEATAPGVIPHYVFRIRPESLLSQVGALGRLALYARVAGLWAYLLVALCNAAAVAGALTWLRGGLDAAVAATAAGLFAAGGLAGAALSRRAFLRRGDIEIVFWDVAGEHVYSGSAADYYSFLSALVRARRQRASARRSYAFAPVLLCNPVSLGTRMQGSSYARLRQLIPLYASLNQRLPRALVAVNRWAVVQQVCAPDSDREERVAVAPRARPDDDGDPEAPGEEPDAPAADAGRAALPVVKRDVVRQHCLDAEDGMESDVHFSYLRYDAGIQCEFREHPWTAWEDLDAEVKSRWRAPAATPGVVLEYIYEDGPGSFEGEVRRTFLNWVAALAFHEASYGPTQARESADVDGASADASAAEAAFARLKEEQRRAPGRAESPPEPPEGSDAPSNGSDAPPDGWPAAEAWRPKPLSAVGLEEFSRGTIATDEARDEAVGDAIDASLALDEGAGDAGPRKPPAAIVPEDDEPEVGEVGVGEVGEPGEVEGGEPGEVEGGEPGDGVSESSAPAQGEVADRETEDGPPGGDREPARRPGETLRMPGGFGSGGT